MPRGKKLKPEAPAKPDEEAVREDELGADDPTQELPKVDAGQVAAPPRGKDEGSAKPRRAAHAPEPAPSAERPAVGVELINGPDDGRVIPIESDLLLIGRDPDPEHREARLDGEQARNAQRIEFAEDPKLSRTHLLLAWRDRGWWARDLKSTNGTKLGTRERDLDQEEQSIELGQPIRAGDTRFRLVPLPLTE